MASRWCHVEYNAMAAWYDLTECDRLFGLCLVANVSCTCEHGTFGHSLENTTAVFIATHCRAEGILIGSTYKLISVKLPGFCSEPKALVPNYCGSVQQGFGSTCFCGHSGSGSASGWFFKLEQNKAEHECTRGWPGSVPTGISNSKCYTWIRAGFSHRVTRSHKSKLMGSQVLVVLNRNKVD